MFGLQSKRRRCGYYRQGLSLRIKIRHSQHEAAHSDTIPTGLVAAHRNQNHIHWASALPHVQEKYQLNQEFDDHVQACLRVPPFSHSLIGNRVLIFADGIHP